MQDFFIGIAAHKAYRMPTDKAYVPIQVGAAGKKTILNFTRDDSGKNISKLNKNYSELTGLYYIWKNVDAEYKGLVHYRRFFGKRFMIMKKRKNPFTKILDTEDLRTMLKKTDIILPQKRRYYVETNYSHYIHAHKPIGLDSTMDIVENMYPEYLSAFKYVMGKRSAHMFNMFVMKSEVFDEYCEWLFSILFKLQENLDISEFSTQESRVFGYVSELLLDVWIRKNKMSYVESPVVYIEGKHALRKGLQLIQRKIVGHGEAHIKSNVD